MVPRNLVLNRVIDHEKVKFLTWLKGYLRQDEYSKWNKTTSLIKIISMAYADCTFNVNIHRKLNLFFHLCNFWTAYHTSWVMIIAMVTNNSSWVDNPLCGELTYGELGMLLYHFTFPLCPAEKISSIFFRIDGHVSSVSILEVQYFNAS